MGKGLEGLNVLELGGGITAAVATKLMADLGATVVKVEPPGGDPARAEGPFRGGVPDPEAGGLFLGLNANKRSLVLDLAAPQERERLHRLIARADVLVHNVAPAAQAALGIDPKRFAALNPRLVQLSITPYGMTGPYRDYAEADLTLIHGGGWGYVCPSPGMTPDLPPLKPFGRHALIQAGLHGGFVALAAAFDAMHSGRGEVIDLSVHEVVASLLGRHLMEHTYTGRIPTRLTPRTNCPSGFFPCKDTAVFIHVSEEAQWKRFVTMLGRPELAEMEGFHPREVRGANSAQVEAALLPLLAEWTAEELFLAAQENRVCVCQVFGFDGLAAHEHLRARGFVAEQHHPRAGRIVMPGAPYALQGDWWALRSPAPALGELNGQGDDVFGEPPALRRGARRPNGRDRRPLAGIRVLDFTWVWAGPYTTFCLSNLGAEVFKVESAHRPDRTRRANNYPPELGSGLNRMGTFNALGQGKKSVSLNLATDEGKALARRMALACDVVISNFGTGVMERLGMGAADLHAEKPDLVIAAISGFGHTGPYRRYTGYGQAICAQGGLSAQTGYPGGEAQEVATAYGDPNAAIYVAFAIAAALVARDRYGGGQFIDASLWETMAATSFEGWLNHALGNPPYKPMGNRDPRCAPHNLYRCRGDDAWLALAVTREAQWPALCAAMGQPALAADPRFADHAARKAHEDELDALIGAWAAGQDPWEATARLQAAGVAAFPSVNLKELVEDPHLAARDFFTRIPHPEVGVRLCPGTPWRFRHRPWAVPDRAPLLGEHTDAVLGGVLGLDAAELATLRAAGALE